MRGGRARRSTLRGGRRRKQEAGMTAHSASEEGEGGGTERGQRSVKGSACRGWEGQQKYVKLSLCCGSNVFHCHCFLFLYEGMRLDAAPLE